MPGGVLWPGDSASFTLQFVNNTSEPIRAAGRLDVIRYGTQIAEGDIGRPRADKLADAGSTPLSIHIPPRGYVNVTVRPAIPESFGGYLLVADLLGYGRQVVGTCVRTPTATPRSACSSRSWPWTFPAHRWTMDSLAMFKRLGIKVRGRRSATTARRARTPFTARLAQSAEMMAAMRLADITLLATVSLGGPQPMGEFRPHLNDDNTTKPGKFDMAGLPSVDEDFQNWCRILRTTFGWPAAP